MELIRKCMGSGMNSEFKSTCCTNSYCCTEVDKPQVTEMGVWSCEKCNNLCSTYKNVMMESSSSATYLFICKECGYVYYIDSNDIVSYKRKRIKRNGASISSKHKQKVIKS